MKKKCSGYIANISGHFGLRRVCNCHWMQKPFENRAYYEKG